MGDKLGQVRPNTLPVLHLFGLSIQHFQEHCSTRSQGSQQLAVRHQRFETQHLDNRQDGVVSVRQGQALGPLHQEGPATPQEVTGMAEAEVDA